MPSATAELRRTALHQSHRALGARLVDFNGWELPLQYEGILKEHAAVRNLCGLFDVSHMGQIWVRGPQALAFLQRTNTNDIGRIGPGKAIYSHLPNERGGVVDDVIIACLARDRYLVVVNAGTTAKDFQWLRRHARGLEVGLEDQSDGYGMVAVQGPRAQSLMALEVPQAVSLPRFGVLEADLFDQRSLVLRTGYTGEDGFELIVPREIVSRVWENLLTKGRSLGAHPCGLGARDTLRLEAGYLLYGQDIDEEHTSLEAGASWVVKLEKGDFIGREALLRQKKEGLWRKLAGITLLEKGVPRPGAPVLLEGRVIGSLTSGTFAPTLQVGVGVGYLDRADLKPGTRLAVEVHGRSLAAQVAKLPFYQSERHQNVQA